MRERRVAMELENCKREDRLPVKGLKGGKISGENRRECIPSERVLGATLVK